MATAKNLLRLLYQTHPVLLKLEAIYSQTCLLSAGLIAALDRSLEKHTSRMQGFSSPPGATLAGGYFGISAPLRPGPCLRICTRVTELWGTTTATISPVYSRSRVQPHHQDDLLTFMLLAKGIHAPASRQPIQLAPDRLKGFPTAAALYIYMLSSYLVLIPPRKEPTTLERTNIDEKRPSLARHTAASAPIPISAMMNNAFPRGTRVWFWDNSAVVKYGTVLGTARLADGTQFATVQVDGETSPQSIPIASLSRVT